MPNRGGGTLFPFPVYLWDVYPWDDFFSCIPSGTPCFYSCTSLAFWKYWDSFSCFMELWHHLVAGRGASRRLASGKGPQSSCLSCGSNPSRSGVWHIRRSPWGFAIPAGDHCTTPGFGQTHLSPFWRHIPPPFQGRSFHQNRASLGQRPHRACLGRLRADSRDSHHSPQPRLKFSGRRSSCSSFSLYLVVTGIPRDFGTHSCTSPIPSLFLRRISRIFRAPWAGPGSVGIPLSSPDAPPYAEKFTSPFCSSPPDHPRGPDSARHPHKFWAPPSKAKILTFQTSALSLLKKARPFFFKN